MKNYVCLDVGGTFIKHGVVDGHGFLLKSSFSATQAMAGGPAVLENMISIVRKYQKEKDISGVCISTTGAVDNVAGSIQYASWRMPQYAGIQIKKRMEETLEIPCEVENDVNCAGLAESISGAAKDSNINLILTIGTGIGGCVTVNKKVYHGFNNVACAVGYMQT